MGFGVCMTKAEAKALLQIVAGLYPNWKPENLGMTVNVWASVLEDEDAQTMAAALKIFAKEDKAGFAPAPGQLLALKKRVEYAKVEALLIAKQYGLPGDRQEVLADGLRNSENGGCGGFGG